MKCKACRNSLHIAHAILIAWASSGQLMEYGMRTRRIVHHQRNYKHRKRGNQKDVEKRMRKALRIQDERLKGCECGKDGDTGAPGMWGTVRGQWRLNTTWCLQKDHVEAHPGVHVP